MMRVAKQPPKWEQLPLQLAFDLDRLDADPPEPDDPDELPGLLPDENEEGGEL